MGGGYIYYLRASLAGKRKTGRVNADFAPVSASKSEGTSAELVKADRVLDAKKCKKTPRILLTQGLCKYC